MRTPGSMTPGVIGGPGWSGLCAVVGAGLLGLVVPSVAVAGAGEMRADALALGREIFHREWLPGDGRSHGGDGLGPVYNDTSCVACHNAGGPGGGGPASKNIDILSASLNRTVSVFLNVDGPAGGAPAQGIPPAPATDGARAAPPKIDDLVAMHAGFREGRTVVLHRFGSDPNYDSWRLSLFTSRVVQSFPAPLATTDASLDVKITPPAPPASPVTLVTGGLTVTATPLPPAATDAEARLQAARSEVLRENPALAVDQSFAAGAFLVTRSERNPTPLFGLGLIDAIPAGAIEEAASRRFDGFPEVQGRVSRLKDGRVGRLGWKGQTAGSEDFVLTACAVELGLEVPGHHQSTSPLAPKYQATGPDLSADECSALVAYVRSLPRPVERVATTRAESAVLAEGKALFASIGCATCHAPSLGGVDGIYSDLLLHDMGAELGDSGSYNGGSDDDDPLNPILAADPGQGAQPLPPGQARPDRPASRQEWRTPPLWGVRDSGPYLHDGRAQTLEQAIALHGGQGATSAHRFFALSPRQRLQVEAFLKSLVAPGADRVE